MLDYRMNTTNPMFVGLDYLCRKYEGMPLDRFIAKYVKKQ